MPTAKQRRAAERRRLQRQAQRRQQQSGRRRRLNVVLSVVGVVAIVGLVVTLISATNGSDSKSTTAKSTAPATASTSAAASTSASSSSTKASSATSVSCSYPKSGTAARSVSTPSTTASKVGTAQILLTTSQGPMTFTLNRAAAPCTVNSFVSLTRQKYYDATTCHRLTTASIFVVQCGDPLGTGTGGPGYSYADELTGKEKYTRGVLAMANTGANTNGSQFFIVYKDTQLAASYTVFGTVTAGLAVVDKVAKAGTSNGSSDGKPKLTLRFTKVSVG